MTKIGIIGATGYVGAELLRLLLAHPKVHVSALYILRNNKCIIEGDSKYILCGLCMIY